MLAQILTRFRVDKICFLIRIPIRSGLPHARVPRTAHWEHGGKPKAGYEVADEIYSLEIIFYSSFTRMEFLALEKKTNKTRGIYLAPHSAGKWLHTEIVAHIASNKTVRNVWKRR